MMSLYTESSDQKTEIQNIICCLRFLQNEAVASSLGEPAKIIGHAITNILQSITSKPLSPEDNDSSELVSVSRMFITYYLLCSHTERQALMNLISRMDEEHFESYVH